MELAHRSLLPVVWSCCCPMLWICRVVVVLAVLVLAVVLALHGYPPAAITGPVLVLAVGAVGAANRLAGNHAVEPHRARPHGARPVCLG